MKQAKTIRQETYKKELHDLVSTNEDSRLVKNKYRVMKYILHKEWRNLINGLEPEILDGFLKDVIYVDRKIREVTEPYDQTEKARLEKEYLEENFNPTP